MSLKGVSSGILVMIERGRCLVGGLSQVLVLDNQAWGGSRWQGPSRRTSEYREHLQCSLQSPRPASCGDRVRKAHIEGQLCFLADIYLALKTEDKELPWCFRKGIRSYKLETRTDGIFEEPVS